MDDWPGEPFGEPRIATRAEDVGWFGDINPDQMKGCSTPRQPAAMRFRHLSAVRLRNPGRVGVRHATKPAIRVALRILRSNLRMWE